MDTKYARVKVDFASHAKMNDFKFISKTKRSFWKECALDLDRRSKTKQKFEEKESKKTTNDVKILYYQTKNRLDEYDLTVKLSINTN